MKKKLAALLTLVFFGMTAFADSNGNDVTVSESLILVSINGDSAAEIYNSLDLPVISNFEGPVDISFKRRRGLNCSKVTRSANEGGTTRYNCELFLDRK